MGSLLFLLGVLQLLGEYTQGLAACREGLAEG